MIVEELKKSVLDSAFKGKLLGSARKFKKECNKEQLLEIQNRLKKEQNVNFKKVINPALDDIYDIPNNWEWFNLGDVVYNWGQMTPNEEFSYIDISSINNIDCCLSDNENIIEPCKAPSRARKIVKPGDIIYSTVRPYLHNMAIVNRDFSRVPIASTGFAVMHCIDFLYNKYLFYYLMSPQFDLYANSNENAVGIAYPAINDEKLYRALIPIPPIEEQKAIVQKIETIFDKLSETKPIEEKLLSLKESFSEDIKFSILDSAIKGLLCKNNPDETVSFKVNKHDFDDVFEIPSNWIWTKIGDVLNVDTGLSFSKTDQCKESQNALRILRGGNINNNYEYLLKDDDIYVNMPDKYISLKEGDVLTPSVTSMEQMGKTAYVDKELNNITAGGFVYIMRTKDREILHPKYAMYYINSKFHKNMCKPNINKSGQAFYNLRKSGLINQPIPIPPIEEQIRIVNKIESILPIINKINT